MNFIKLGIDKFKEFINTSTCDYARASLVNLFVIIATAVWAVAQVEESSSCIGS
jgi:hypothetical protein